MKITRALLPIFAAVVTVAEVAGSGPVGVFAVIERVAFEPNEKGAERLKVWGAFSFVDGGIQSNGTTAAPQRGYLYFRRPSASEAPAQSGQLITNEWSDLKAIAGTGQAVAFGSFDYVGVFGDEGPRQVFVTVQFRERGFMGLPLRIYADAETKPEPAPYLTNTGIVKIPDTGNHAAIVKRLRDRLKQPSR